MNCECCNRFLADNKRTFLAAMKEREELLSVLKDEREAIGRYIREANVAKAKLEQLRCALVKVTRDHSD